MNHNSLVSAMDHLYGSLKQTTAIFEFVFIPLTYAQSIGLGYATNEELFKKRLYSFKPRIEVSQRGSE